MRIVVRCDSSRLIGTGHAARCLTLADGLAGRGHDVAFVCRAHPGGVDQQIEDRGYPVYRLPAPSRPGSANESTSSSSGYGDWLGETQLVDAQQTIAALNQSASPAHAQVPVDWLIIDHYALGEAWQQALRPHCRKLMVIDDLADRRHDCDLILDQNGGELVAARYAELVPGHCTQLIGSRYALLHSEFSRLRAILDREFDAPVQRVLVSFGGVDASNQTGKVLDAVALLTAPAVHLDVVIGSANPHQATLRRQADALGNVHLHVQTGQMAALIAAADMGIGAGGATTWERCCLGLPTLAWSVAANQDPIIADTAASGAIYSPDPDQVQDAHVLAIHIGAMLHSCSLRRHLSEQAATLCDGAGVTRICAALGGDEVHLRQATPDDCDLVFAWRNAPEVRRASLDPSPVIHASHRDWFQRALSDPARDLLIAQAGSVGLGTLRFDYRTPTVEISIYLAPGVAGRGVGTLVLDAGERWLRENRPEIRRVSATVLDRNEVSARLFLRQGFTKHHSVFYKVLADE